MTRQDQLVRNMQTVCSAITQACQNTKRNPADVTLLAVTKYAPDADVLALLEKGLLRAIGESRIQQAWMRWHENPQFARFKQVQKHFIGHLQLNKVAKAAVLFDWIDSIDDFQTVHALSKHLPAGKFLHILVQVKLSQKETQFGLPLPLARRLASQLKGAFENIDVCGYMAVAPQGANEQTLRGLFRDVKSAFDQDFKGHPRAHLSLGMSEDFRLAVEEGSTLPRIGSRLFNSLEGV